MTVFSSIRGLERLPFRDGKESIEVLESILGAASRAENHAHGHSVPGVEMGHGHGSGDTHHHRHSTEDPHVWLSPLWAGEIALVMAEDLATLMPEQAGTFKERARSLVKELEELDRELAAMFRTVPGHKRVFLTFHPSWRYFAQEYGLIELSIEAEGKEPGPRGLAAVTELARRAGIRTVFVEPQFPKNSARAVAEALGANIVVADPLEENLPQLYRSMADKLMTAFAR